MQSSFYFHRDKCYASPTHKGLSMSDQITIKEYVAEKLMESYGWDLNKKDESPLEWDPTRDDSQYSMALDTAETAIHHTLEALDLLEQQTESQREVLFSDMTTYLMLDPGEDAKNIYLFDVIRFVQEAEALEIPSDTRVEGFLHLMLDQKLQLISEEHPSVATKSPSRIKQLELETARKKIDYLIKQGDTAEAEKVLAFIREKEESLDS